MGLARLGRMAFVAVAFAAIAILAVALVDTRQQVDDLARSKARASEVSSVSATVAAVSSEQQRLSSAVASAGLLAETAAQPEDPGTKVAVDRFVAS